MQKSHFAEGLEAELKASGIEFALLELNSAEAKSLTNHLDETVPFGPFAHIEWENASGRGGFSASSHAELYQNSVEKLKKTAFRFGPKSHFYVVSLNAANPVFQLSGTHFANAVEMLLDLHPLLVLELQQGWVFEWRRSFEVAWGYFESTKR